MATQERSVFAVLPAAVLLFGLAVSPVFAAQTTIKVDLWDRGAAVDMMTNMGMMMKPGMMATEMAMAPMGIMISAATVSAGEITFDVTNTSKEVIHEMVVSPVSDPAGLPYDEQSSKVDEDAAGHLGEVAELDPGATGSLTLTFKPGTYILYCNIPGHYASGMWTLITVQ